MWGDCGGGGGGGSEKKERDLKHQIYSFHLSWPVQFLKLKSILTRCSNCNDHCFLRNLRPLRTLLLQWFTKADFLYKKKRDKNKGNKYTRQAKPALNVQRPYSLLHRLLCPEIFRTQPLHIVVVQSKKIRNKAYVTIK